DRLRVSLVLDSCYSGAFLLDFVDCAVHKHDGLLYPFASFASAMPDEVSWEDDDLGHGLGTYCFSTRPLRIGSMAASSVQPDNSMGQSLALAQGSLGCSLLTSG